MPEEEIEDKSESVDLLIGRHTCAVLVLVIRVEFGPRAHGENAARVNRSGAPFAVLTVVVKLRACIQGRMVSVDCNRPLQCEPVAITPVGIAVLEIDFQPVPIREEQVAL